jgi:endoglucanase
MNGEIIVVTPSNNYLVMDVEEETSYEFSIVAIDYAGNRSDAAVETLTTSKLEPVVVPAMIKSADYLMMAGVQTEDTKDEDGGKNVGWIDNGDWMEYVIDVQEGGKYVIDYRIASLPGMGIIQFADNKGNVYTTTEVPLTEGWQNWQTVTSEPIELEAGVKIVRLVAQKGGFNINWFDIKKVD